MNEYKELNECLGNRDEIESVIVANLVGLGNFQLCKVYNKAFKTSYAVPNGNSITIVQGQLAK